MIWPFRRKKTSEPTAQLSRAEAQYRQQRIDEVMDSTGRDRAEVEKLLDTWTIARARVQSGDETEPREEYLPYPLWDDEALLTRDSFPTLREALDEIIRHGGSMEFDPAQHFAQPEDAGE